MSLLWFTVLKYVVGFIILAACAFGGIMLGAFISKKKKDKDK